MAGLSGGGYICFGAAKIFVKSGEANLVKAQFILSGMLSDETANIDTYYLKSFEKNQEVRASLYKMLATDYDG